MKKPLLRWLFAGSMLLPVLPALSATDEFQIGLIAHPAVSDAALRAILSEADADNLAFVVAGGIKSAAEPCSDEIYERRKDLLNASKNGLIVSVAASDWSDCRYHNGRLAAVERLNRVRELFFRDEFSFGESKLPLVRESANVRFRDYSENMRWFFGDILFATVHLPADNNHYLAAAGRNGEFEDRQIANHDWLLRLFTIARRKKAAGIVLFSDGSPLVRMKLNGRHDGFAEIRSELGKLAAKFPGKILVIHNRILATDQPANGIVWNGNLGDLTVTTGWVKLAIAPSRRMPFQVLEQAKAKTDPSQ